MAGSVQPCGCTFDPEFVDSAHDSGADHPHKLKGKKTQPEVVIIPEVPEEEKASFLDKVLPKSKKSKDGD